MLNYIESSALILFLLVNLTNASLINSASFYQDITNTNQEDTTKYPDSSKEFWENMYQYSIVTPRTKFNALSGSRVCFTCPIDRTTFQNLYQEVGRSSHTPANQAPPRVSISWATQMAENRVIFFCRNNSRISSSPVYLASDNDGKTGGELDYSCENNRLCLSNVKSSYPDTYQCMVKSYVLNVKLNVVVELKDMLLYFVGDSVKFDYQKEVQVHENQVFTIKCEVLETNPVSNVAAYIDKQEIKMSRLEKKTYDNRMSINAYSFDVNATRSMNGKRVKCEAHMKDLPTELANTLDLRSYMSKDYTLAVYYLPTCVYKERVYKTGINRSLTIECPINGSNPDVTHYKMIPPSTRTKYELVDNNLDTLKRVGRFRLNPQSHADFGLYECIPRSLAGTAKCDILVELGATPNPPEQCTVQFATVNNKTFAQFSCRPGYNQGGTSSFLTIYELTPGDKQMKLSGRVNIDESKVDKDVPYITPADEDKYYEFLIMQENNYGNSTSVLLTLGNPQETKVASVFESKKVYMIGGIVAAVVFVVCLCGCCCCSDLLSGTKSDNACCKCCSPSDSLEDDGPTYKKAMDSDVVGQSFPSYSQDTSLSKAHMSLTSNMQAYEYTYDNTRLLNESHYTRHQQFQQKSKPKESDEDSYQHNYDDDDNEPYMNDHDDMLKSDEKPGRRHYDDNEENYSSNENSNDSLVSSEQKSSDVEQSYKITSQTLANTAAMFNNNVGTAIGSGVESVKKNFSSTLNKPYKQSPNHSSRPNYSTMDSKNLKLIKTDNGLVYTPINPQISQKMIEEEEDCYNNIKRLTNGKPQMPQQQTNGLNKNFQNELSLRLKSMNKGEQQNELYSKINANKPIQAKFNPQSEHLSNSTATTSVSSASSCASNSDLVIKKESVYTLDRRLAPLASEMSDSSNNSANNVNKSYSLLKTTLNVNGDANKNQQNGTYKPPIKPKPKNGIYGKIQQNSTSDSLHNQSVEPLINGNCKETSEHTSPSTSVTDVSSTNCTPQHYNSNLDEQANTGANLIIKKPALPRSRSNSTSRNNPESKNGNQQLYTSINGNKATTTFGTLGKNANGVDPHSPNYLNVNLGGQNLKTFNGGLNNSSGHYDNATIGRNKYKANNGATIDDEIHMIHHHQQHVNGNHVNGGRPMPNSMQRTLERRHVKNSEC